MEFNETLKLGLEHPILSNNIQKYGRKPCLGGRRPGRREIALKTLTWTWGCHFC